ncbi:hypothetical protein [Boudabousia marimammalium]|uniref:Uncharacterized protein n=1 Tax=Boudabousia marimammalium TaxID=156892 RepID=A0A1Q5PM69_9ACTO|nr:hypothetical protein [Boudabousia marimammalium]OKL48077.1 hypothetical protein BM477_06340 [Boudabousia marimammalium]
MTSIVKVSPYWRGRNWEIVIGAGILIAIALIFIQGLYFRFHLGGSPVPRDIPMIEILTLIYALAAFVSWVPSAPIIEQLSVRRLEISALSFFLIISVLLGPLHYFLWLLYRVLPTSILQSILGLEIARSPDTITDLFSATIVYQSFAFIGLAALTVAVFGKIAGPLISVTAWVAMVFGQSVFYNTQLPWPSIASARYTTITTGGQAVAIIIFLAGGAFWMWSRGGAHILIQPIFTKLGQIGK